MRRPLVLATTLAAELAVGTLALAPPAAAQSTPDGPLDPPTVEPTGTDPEPVPADPTDPVPPPVRTGRSDPLPVEVPSALPDAVPAVPVSVRSGRLDEPPPTTPDLDAPDSQPAVPPTPAATPRDRTDRADGAGEAPGTTTSPSAATPAPATPPTPAAGATDHRVVASGDHLWAIAAEQVAATTGRPASDLAAGDVVTYWVQLCMMNRPHLRSGNPSLIYPGEVIELPPV